MSSDSVLGSRFRAAVDVSGFARHRALELLRRPAAHVADDVPTGPSAITADWLTATLCRDHPGARVESFVLSGDSSGTTNRASIDLTYSGGSDHSGHGLPNRVFAKFTTGLTSRLILGLSQVIQGEVGFYRHVRPLVDLDAPRGYYGSYDLASGRTALLMEDVARSQSATFLSPLDSLTRSEAVCQVELLAELHATTHGRDDLFAKLEGLHTPLWRLEHADRMVGLSKRLDVGITRSSAVLPDGFVERRSEVWAALHAAMELCTRGEQFFLHADAHLGNWYRQGDGRIGASDWQMVARGSWAFDIGYALSNSLTIRDRREWEEDLVRHYVDQLALRGGPRLDFDEAWLGYRQQFWWGLNAWLATIGRSALMPHMQPDAYSLSALHRISHAIDDHGAFDLVLDAT